MLPILVPLALLVCVAASVWLFRSGRTRLGIASVVVPLGCLLAAGGYAWHLDRQLDHINRTSTAPLTEGKRPEPGKHEALTILLLGSDDPSPSHDKPSVAELLEDGKWRAGAYRSDTIMLLHIPADRRNPSFISIPRDSYVELRTASGEARRWDKINAAFSEEGPLATWRTVEALSDVRIDHVAIVDFTGFRALTEELGGVEVFVPETIHDPKQAQTWTRGWHHVEGDLALKYVRMRYGLDEGDFDRVARQQNFIRALLTRVTSLGVLTNPVRLSGSLEAASRSLTVDEGWSKDAIRSLALSMRGTSLEDSQFLTLPLERYESVEGVGSVNIIDEVPARQLWRALRNGRLAAYARAHPDDALEPPTQVD